MKIKYIFILLNLFILYLSFRFNKNHKNKKKRNINFNYYKTILFNFTIINLLILFFFDKIQTIFSYSDDFFRIIFDIIIISVSYDTWLYWMHRSILHRTPYFKKNFHEIHHTKYVIPTDWLHVHLVELTIQSMGIFVPLLFYRLNLYSFVIFCILKQLYEIYIHSDTEKNILPKKIFITSNFHTNHHKGTGKNYAQLFTFWDNIMNTK